MEVAKMKKILYVILGLLLLTGCNGEGNSKQDVTDDLYSGNGDSATSQMVDERYYLTGELMEKEDLALLIDSQEAGLVWVSFEALPEIELSIHSTIRILYGGAIMESYPGQARGTMVEVLEPFDEAFIHSYDDMVAFLENGDVYHVVEWNKVKDHVAYAQLDETAAGLAYFVRVASLYEETSTLVGYVEGELPDLAWFYDTLQIQTGDSFTDVYPPYNEIEMK